MENNLIKTSRQYDLDGFSVGDIVNAKWGANWLEAEILSEREDGLWQVQFQDG
jgi:hypothetical protein